MEIQHCLYTCSNYRECHGFNYHRKDKKCMVLYESGIKSFDSDSSPRGDLINEDGWVFYQKIQV